MSPERELLNDLGKLAKVLLKKQVHQTYLKQKIKMTDSSIKKRYVGRHCKFPGWSINKDNKR